MKVALIHDHLAQDGGAEKVLAVFAAMYPEAKIYTLLYDQKNISHLKGHEIDTSIIQRLPGGVKHYRWYLQFMPMAVEFFDLREFDLVISDTSSFAKGVITLPDTLHLCYCHTPTRYLWSDTHQYLNELKYNKYFKKIIGLVLNRLRLWDFCAAQRVDFFMANSQMVAGRIKKYYRRDSQVIYPPVETTEFHISDQMPTKEKEYFLAGCRLVPYKRIDLVIEAFNLLGDSYTLKIFGDGLDEERLKKIAANNPRIEFLGRVTDEEKARLYQNALAFINPQEEDFGITPVESMASGRPVIAYRKGGVMETVVEGKTGLFFNEQKAEALVEVLKSFRSEDFNPQEIWEHAQKFSVARFKEQIEKFIAEKKAQI